MIACENCGQANMAYSKFCRECGVALSPVPVSVLQEENQKMVSDARRLFGDGRYEEAALISTAILEDDPECVEALALRGDCHERLGEYDSAVDCYRHILKIQPDSQLDRIRVARLEKLVVSNELEVGEPRHGRRTALGAAFAAAVLLVSSGSALIIASSGTGQEISSQAVKVGASSTPFISVPPIPGIRDYVRLENQSAPGNSDLEDLTDVLPGGLTVPELRRNPGNRIGLIADATGSAVLDPVVPSKIDLNRLTGTPFDLGLEPSTRLGGITGIDDPDPNAVSISDEGDDQASKMIVDVRASDNIDPTAGSQTVGDGATEAETLIRVARHHYIVGDFAKAADAWEKALAAGASPASTNQRLAQSYEKLNRKADAMSAYKRSIEEFEKLDQNDERVKSALDSCRQALKVLEGE